MQNGILAHSFAFGKISYMNWRLADTGILMLARLISPPFRSIASLQAYIPSRYWGSQR